MSKVVCVDIEKEKRIELKVYGDGGSLWISEQDKDGDVWKDNGKIIIINNDSVPALLAAIEIVTEAKDEH